MILDSRIFIEQLYCSISHGFLSDQTNRLSLQDASCCNAAQALGVLGFSDLGSPL